MSFVYWIHLAEHTDMYSEGYIGVSDEPAKRLKEHTSLVKNNKHYNPYLSRVFKKYKDTIIQTIIFEGGKSHCYLNEEILRPKPGIGWNINKGGDCPPSTLGKSLSTEHKAKISIGNTGKKHPMTNETKEKLSVALTGRVCSDEHKQKVREARKNQIITKETGKKISAALKGKIPNNAKSIKTPLGTFETITQASKAHSVSLHTMINWANSTAPEKSNFTYINKNKI